MSKLLQVRAEEPETVAEPAAEVPVPTDKVQQQEEQAPPVTQEEEAPPVTEEDEIEDDDDEEVEDPQNTMNEEKTNACSKYKNELDACTERVGAKSNTTETCEQELYDFVHCRDVKVAMSLFSKLK